MYRPNFLRNPIPKNCAGVLCGIYVTSNFTLNKNKTLIIITPTNKRLERLPDLTRFSQTLMHIKNLHWIVIEDGIEIYDAVNRLLKRSNIPYAYFFAAKELYLPAKGWTQRNNALEYLRKYYRNFDGNAIVYFADDDNTYDIRLFNNFIKNVKQVGVWPVGIVGGAVVEGPIVQNNKVINWQAIYKPNRTFAIDMAGFAVNLNLILSSNATFGYQCIYEAPEDCFLTQLGIRMNDLEPFGYKNNYKDVLVWHTKTAKSNVVNNNNNSFVMETENK
uniref:Galactosylgalactosylxylosylprotein 3-beta-glucuronosyltransferase n=1 Tax=Panagrolaimus davidi TaxID=227884 RepID=A0A914PE68_9BILA